MITFYNFNCNQAWKSDSDVPEVIIAKIASLLSGVAEGDEACDNSFDSLGEDAE